MNEQTVGPREYEALLRLVHVLMPEDAAPKEVYERTARHVVDVAAGHGPTQCLLRRRLADLAQLGFALAADAEAIAQVQSIERTPFFRFVRGTAVAYFYSDPEIYEQIGYEGASYDKGGYLHRGFDDLDWLPNPTIEVEASS